MLKKGQKGPKGGGGRGEEAVRPTGVCGGGKGRSGEWADGEAGAGLRAALWGSPGMGGGRGDT